MTEQTESRTYKKIIHLPLGDNFYKLEWDGYQYAITVNDSDRRIHKYPTTLTGAMRVIFKEEMVNEKDPEPVSLMEYAKQVDDMVRNLSSENFELLEEEMKISKPMSEETKAKIKAAKAAKKELENNPPVEEEDDEEDDI